MKTKVTIAGNLLQIGAVIWFASSFFVKDNDKAVSRRWTALGVGALGLATSYYAHVALKASK